MSSRSAFGYCPDRPFENYLFAPVLAQVVDDQLVRVGSPPNTPFPPNGTIYIPREYIPRPFNFQDVALWDVQDQQAYADQGLGARYRAIRLRPDTPAEVVSVPANSDETDRIRHILLDEGLSFASRLLDRDVLLEFADGTVAGPIRFDTVTEDSHHRMLEAKLHRPLPAWANRTPFEPLALQVGSTRRTFATRSRVPPPTLYLDLASVGHALESLFRSAGAVSVNGSRVLSVPELQALARQLRELPGPEELACRRQRLSHLLGQSEMVRRQLTEWTQRYGTALGVERAMVESTNGVPPTTPDEGQLSEQAVRLRDECLDLEKRLAALQAEMLTEERRKDTIATGVAEAIRVRAVQAQRDAARTLADAAVLRPFLSGGGSAESAGPSMLTERAHDDNCRLLDTFASAVSHLTAALEQLGVQPPSAKPLARECLTAVSFGQALFFCGSLAGPVAHAVAAALAGRKRVALQVPAGLTTGTDVQRLLQECVESGSGRSALVLEGANRSPFEAYASAVSRLFGRRYLGFENAAPRVMVIGTLLDAPAPELTSYGPVIATDFLAWKKPVAPKPLLSGEWSVPLGPERAVDERAFDELMSRLCPYPDELWRQNALQAYRRLAAAATDADTVPAEASVLFGWVLPKPAATGVDLASHARYIDRFAPAVAADARLKRWLQAHGVAV